MAKGWIKLHRKLLDNPMWLEEPFTKGQAWVDLLMLADGIEDGQYKRGCVYRGKEWLSNRWGWSRGKVDRFLKQLENDKMIKQIHTKGGVGRGTITIILKYKAYQDNATQYGAQDEAQNGAHLNPVNTDFSENGETHDEAQYRTRNNTPIRRKEDIVADANAPAKKEIKIIPWEEDYGMDPGECIRIYEEQLKNGNSV